MMNSSKLILLIDDDRDLTRLVSSFLTSNGFTVEVSNTGEGAADLILLRKPDLVLLDLMLPVEDGMAICRRVRNQYQGKIIMLTALGEDVDQVAGLELGADDYLSKPVAPRLLLARIRANLRSFTANDKQHDHQQHNNEICLGALCINHNLRTVQINTEVIDLTTAEFDLLYYLMLYPGQVLSRERLYQNLYRYPYDGHDRALDLCVSRLRRKIELHLPAEQLIKTVRAQGYLLAV